jgi:Photosynthetic reaction centre cytochrome C subunit
MRRPLVASLVLAVIATLAVLAFVRALIPAHALAATTPPPQQPGTPPGAPPGGMPPNGMAPGMGAPPGPGGPGGPGGREMAPFDTSMGHADTMVAEMLKRLGDKAKMPAESVYKNIDILKGMPAGNLPKVMVYGFSRGLGVRCGYCHVRDDFASDDRPHKKAAREMWKMSLDINRTYLAQMKSLEDEAPIVNCWTCHRSKPKPDETPMR